MSITTPTHMPSATATGTSRRASTSSSAPARRECSVTAVARRIRRSHIPDMSLAAVLLFAASQNIANPNIDMAAYLRAASEAAAERQTHRLTEDEFIAMSRMPGTVILDARSAEMYRLRHVRGAINLSFPDIAIASLAKLLPDKNTRILIYCNNNFRGDEIAFASKIARASLNLSTYIALYSYGYRNVWELGPLLDVKTTKIELEGTH